MDDVRHWLLLVLPEQPDPTPPTLTGVPPRVLRGREWHAVACAVGDLVEDIASLLAIAVVSGLCIAVAGAIGLWAPWWVPVGLVLTAVATFVVWRLRRAGRVLAEVVSELEDSFQDKENTL